jgi:RNA polymerase sigma-70 factor (ECF subfamily)
MLDLEGLYPTMAPRICRYMERRLPSPHKHVAEDLAADVFVKALAAADRYEDRGLDPSSWLYRIARNILVDYIRTLRFRTDGTPDSGGREVVDARTSSDPTMAVDRIAIERAAARLTRAQRLVIHYRFVEGQDVAVTAAAVSVSCEAVKKLQHRALVNLRRALEAA